MAEWTGQQQRVIDARGCSQMVSAAAGSGKTAVMTEHVIRRIEEGTDITSLVVVTFTQAAAAEMRQRIGARLESAVQRRPQLRRQLEKLDDAWISTFHALCIRIITRYGAVAQIPPGLTAAGEGEQTLLWQDALEDALEAAYARREPGLRLLARGWGGRDGRGLGELVRQLYDYVMARPQGTALIEEMLESTRQQVEDPQGSLWARCLEQERERLRALCLRLLEEALALARAPEGPAGYEASLLSDMEAVREGRRFAMLRGKRKSDSPQAVARVKALRDQAKVTLEKRLLPLNELESGDMGLMLPAVEALCRLTEDAAARYSALKLERGVMDFSDMEHFALQALSVESVAQELSSSFSGVLVDEYQDTNRVQEAILARISREDNLFTVGDVKQAIYGFRQAEPGLFLARCALGEGPQRQLTRLSSNFRSSPAVVDFVNAVFSALMRSGRGGVDYTGEEELRCRAPRPEQEEGPGVSFILLGTEQPDEEDEALAELTRIERQALEAAGEIRARLGRPIYDGKAGGYRTCRWSDFAILLRSRRGKTAPVAQVLEQQGIPAYALGGGGWHEQLEVQQTVALLRLIDNRHRDLELMSTLRSAYGGFTLEELWAIRRASPGESYAAAVERMALEEGELPRRLREFLTRLEQWREDAQVMSAEALIWKILDTSGYYDRMGSLPGGHVRQGNLRLMMDRARGLAGTRSRGLYGLLEHLERLARTGAEGDMAVTLSEAADVVRVTTIHGSKGLEYPVVLLLDLDKPMNNLSRTADRMQMDEEMGFGLRTVTEQPRRWQDTLSRQAMAIHAHRRELSEEVRILYVALTRAREELILIGTARSYEKQLSRWSLPLEAALEAADGSFIQWLGPVILRCPGAQALRDAAGMEEEPLFACPVRVRLPEESAPAPALSALPEQLGPPDPELLEAFAWQYPHRTDLPAKIAATDRVLPAQRPMTWPAEDGRYSAAQRGTFTHAVLERMGTDPRETARQLAASGLIPQDALEELHYPWLEAWLQHPLHGRMARARRVERELPFNLRLSSREALGEEGGDPVMVQGVIDLAFLEEGKWVLVDYKSGNVIPGMEREYLEHYAPQLRLYRLALERLTGIPVGEAGIFILPRGRFERLED